MPVLRVGVVGAGVVGATTALELQSEFPTASVTVVANKFYQDTTSDGAAGLFRPGVEFAGPNQQLTERWIQDSYEYYRDVMVHEPACGVSDISGYFFSNRTASAVRSPLLQKVLPLYRVASHDELSNSSGKFKFGSFFETLVMECPKFLPWALTKFETQGGRVRRQTVDRLNQLQGEFDIVVNCCGLEATYLCGDSKVIPIRGQLLKVSAPCVKNFFYAEGDTYIIPNKSGSISLGGTYNFGSYNTDISGHDSTSILERCTRLLPSLRDATVLREWVGLRPYRAVVRVELEQLGELKVVHNYGHGGYGVTSAPGTAKHAVHLVRQALTCSSKL